MKLITADESDSSNNNPIDEKDVSFWRKQCQILIII